jgi:hypothetical protein
MTETISRLGPFQSRTKWFAERPASRDAARLVSYVQCACTESRLGFVRQPFHTKLVDLRLPEAELLAGMSKGAQYKIKRARREGVACSFDHAVDVYLHFHRQVAVTALRKAGSLASVEPGSDTVCVTAAAAPDGTTLAMHCYLCDPERGRVRLWYSASRYTVEQSSDDRNLVGRANRLLHFEVMLHFKAKGYLIYDLGGYSMDRSDAKKQSINRFKDDFGGTLVAESNYYSYPYHLAHALARLAVRCRDLVRGRAPIARENSPIPAPDLGGDALSASNR